MLCATQHYARVREMMRGFGQATPDTPGLPDAATRMLRVRLLLEEVLELAAAAGVRVQAGSQGPPVRFEDLVFSASDAPPDLVQMLDAFCDISVVNTGGFVACGVPDGPLLAVVDQNNLLKIATGRLCAETGKFIKSPDHPPPDIAAELAALTRLLTSSSPGATDERDADAPAR